ncbi:MAG: N-formylglutamate amidohydrolase [Alphaproteobacteria bacterium]
MVDRATSRISLSPHEGRWLRLARPDRVTLPVVVDSPHSGTDWPSEFKPARTRAEINRLSDLYVDQIFNGVTELGGTLLAARFPRSFIDLNRDQFDVARWQMRGKWRRPIKQSGYGRWGMGVIKAKLGRDIPLYDEKPTADQVAGWIDRYWRPYRRILSDLLDEGQAHFGNVIHINAHSMRNDPPPGARDKGPRPDFVLGDRDGSTCDPRVTQHVAEFLKARGYSVKINHPFAGVDIVRRSGQPKRGIHALQIELNRNLFMDPHTLNARPDDLAKMQALMRDLMATLPELTKQLGLVPTQQPASTPSPR